MVAPALPLSTAVHSNQLEAVEQLCGPALGCAGSDLLGQLLLLAVFGVVTVVLLAALERVQAARGAVAEERSRTATEKEAFERFARRVAGLDPSEPGVGLTTTDGGVAAVSVAGHPVTDRRLEAVREAYRETVMAMAHFEDEYDEPLARHLGQEFGEEVARAVADGDRLRPELKEVLVDRAREAARERERLMHRLDREADGLDAAGDELRAVEAAVRDAEGRSLAGTSFQELADEWNRLGELESRLSRLFSRRQEELKSRDHVAGAAERRSLQGYLYAGLETVHPVLADGAVLADRVKAARSRVLRRLTSQA
ncbi:MAG: hypothetical protein U5J98_07630 [Halobacteriales archaeon]|nr:hypothetical protein [Halobacteriales archaeon]